MKFDKLSIVLKKVTNLIKRITVLEDFAFCVSKTNFLIYEKLLNENDILNQQR